VARRWCGTQSKSRVRETAPGRRWAAQLIPRGSSSDFARVPASPSATPPWTSEVAVREKGGRSTGELAANSTARPSADRHLSLPPPRGFFDCAPTALPHRRSAQNDPLFMGYVGGSGVPQWKVLFMGNVIVRSVPPNSDGVDERSKTFRPTFHSCFYPCLCMAQLFHALYRSFAPASRWNARLSW
jgi:hypothetical protein